MRIEPRPVAIPWGSADAAQDLVGRLLPVVRMRVTRILWRWSAVAKGRDVNQDVDDMVQDVFVALLNQNARVLRSWAPDRGLSLPNFVGLVAERHVLSRLRSARSNPWTEEATNDGELAARIGVDDMLELRVTLQQFLCILVERLHTQLTPLAMQLFVQLFIEQRSVTEVSGMCRMSANSVYVWRNRLVKRARTIASEIP
jgi:RNA polymerase sigma factor (sigma-70 family)